MSRGWESKSVEQQQDAAQNAQRGHKTALSAEEIARHRRRAGLQLQRSQILNSRTANPHRRAALEQALQQIETELLKLEGQWQ